MQESIDSFLSYLLVERGYSPNTIDSYKHAMAQFRSFLAESPAVVNWADIDRDHIRGFLLSLWHRKCAPATVQVRLAAVRSFFRFLHGEGTITSDPTEYIDSPKVGRHLPNVPSIEEVSALLDTIDTSSCCGLRDKAMIEILYGCGLRVSELLSLDSGDVDFSEGYVRVLGKGSKERMLPIGEYALEALREYLKKGRPEFPHPISEPALFLNKKGGRLSRITVFHRIRYLAARLGLGGYSTRSYRKCIGVHGFSPHTFRHCFATHLLSNGADVITVAELLGHASVNTAVIYTHLTVDRLRDEYDRSHPRATE